MKKLTSLLLIFTLIFTLAACSDTTKKEDFKAWFNDEFVAAYDAFKQTEYGKANAPVSDISLMIISSEYLNSVFDYITDGTQPENAEITETDGVYTYKTAGADYMVELDEKTSSVRITSKMEFMGEERTQFIITLRESKNKYYIQHLAPEFKEYFEVEFTAESGSVKRDSVSENPYSIFADKIPDKFAKEN